MEFRFLRTMCVFAALLAEVALSQQAFAAQKKETWLGLPTEFVNQGYALKKGVAVELTKIKVFTTVPISMERAWITPDWADWLTNFRTTRIRVNTTEIVARPSSLARLGTSDGPSTRVVTRVHFESLKLVFGTTTLQLPAGEMRFRADGALSAIRIAYADGVTVELSPAAGGKLACLIQTGAFKWAGLPAFSFDSVAAQGEITDDTVQIDRVGASGTEGAVSGSLRLVSAGKLLLEGELKMEGVHANEVIARLYPSSVVSGYIRGNFKLNASGDTLESLALATAVSGDYEMKNGRIDKFGLLEGMRRNAGGIVGGGQLQFDKIIGKFSGKTGQVAQADFQGLSSGALRGSSNFSVLPDGRLKGIVSGSLMLPGGEAISRKFELGGSVDAPTLNWR